MPAKHRKAINKDIEYLVLRFAKHHDIKGEIGGWIFNQQSNTHSHGWSEFFHDNDRTIKEWIVAVTGINVFKGNKYEEAVNKIFRKRIPAGVRAYPDK